MSNISTHLNNLSFLNNLNYNSGNIKLNSVSYNCPEIISSDIRNSTVLKESNIWRNLTETTNINSSIFNATSSGIGNSNSFNTNNINCNPPTVNNKSTPRIITKTNKKELNSRMNDGDITKFSNGDGEYFFFIFSRYNLFFKMNI